MITRITRPPTPEEVARLTRPVGPRRVDRSLHLTKGLVFAVPGVAMGALVAALLRNLGFFHGMAKGLLVMLLVVTGLFAAWFVWQALANFAKAMLPARPPRAAMTADQARALTLTEIRLKIDQLVLLDVGDDDVAWFLLRCGDRYVSLRSSVLDDIRSDPDGAPVDGISDQMTIVLKGDAVLSIRQRGDQLSQDSVCRINLPSRIPAWCEAEFAEIAPQDLWPQLVEKLPMPG